MSVKFKVVARKNPSDMAAPEKFYATAVGDEEVDLDTLASTISVQCTVTEADCYAVLISLESNIINELKQGRIVKLGKLDNFQVSISSEGMTTPAEVSATNITKSRILFRPAKKMKSFLRDVSFRKAFL